MPSRPRAPPGSRTPFPRVRAGYITSHACSAWSGRQESNLHDMGGSHAPLPFGHARKVGSAGVEPAASRDSTGRSYHPELRPHDSEWPDLNGRPLVPQTSALTKLSYIPSRRDGSIRTCGFLAPNQASYQAGLHPGTGTSLRGPPAGWSSTGTQDLRWRAEGQVHLVGLAGLEPAASCSRSTRSTKLS